MAIALPPTIKDQLERNRTSPGNIVLNATAEFLSDTEIHDRRSGRTFRIYARENESDALLDTLVRMKGSVPILVGSAGVGKTTVVSRAVQKTMLGKFPKGDAHAKALRNSIWISTTPSRILNNVPGDNDAAQIEAFFDAVLMLEKQIQRPIIVFIDEIHTLSHKCTEAMLPYLDSRDHGIKLVGASNSDKFMLTFKDNDAFLRRAQQLAVEELDEATTLETLKLFWIPEIEKKYGVVFEERVAEAVVRNALLINREAGRFDASLKLLQDIAISQIRKDYRSPTDAEAAEIDQELERRGFRERETDPTQNPPGLPPIRRRDRRNQMPPIPENRRLPAPVNPPLNPNEPEAEEDHREPARPVSLEQAYAFIQERTGYPVNPHDNHAMLDYMEALRTKVGEDVIDQPRMVDETLQLFQSVMIGSKKGLGVSAIVGPTGTGKSELGLSIAKHAFKNPKAFLRIDANEYKTGQYSMNKLFGAEGGLVTSDKRSGILCNYFDDPSKGKYGGVILIDEGERAHPDFWERMMEFLDTGSFVGGDGKRRQASKHLIIITSNRGDKILFPEAASQWSEQEIAARMGEITPKSLKDLFLRKISGKDNFSLPPPILNRVDLFTVAGPITVNTARKIVQMTVEKFRKDTVDQFKVGVEVDANVLNYLLRLDYNLRDGARPIIDRVYQVIQNARTQALARMPLGEGSIIRIGIEGVDDRRPNLIVSAEGAETMRLEVARPKIDNPLADPEERERLRRLNAVIKENIWGQDEAVDSVASAVIAHRANPGKRTKPLPLFLLGPTGVGKTALGRALSLGLYDSADRAVVIPLGDITNEAQFNKVFGSEPGYVGSEQERLFEESLRNNPLGGVLIWDEASNMGGKSKELKETFFKKFYNLCDEGRWTSPATGVTYDLSKWVFLFTGNDGEEIFRGLSADELIIDRWEKSHKRDQVRALLVDAGVPAAFVGRQADCILMKPLIRSEVTAIGRKFLREAFAPYEKQGIRFSIDDEFVYRFGHAFFSSDMGARSLRNVAEHRLGGIIAEALLTSGFDPLSDDKPELRFSIDDKRYTLPYSKPAQEPESVKMHVQVVQNETELHRATIDLTEYAHLPGVMSLEQAIKTAYHEAGHAVVNKSKISGSRLGHVTIRIGKMGPDKRYLGYAHYDTLPGFEHVAMTREVAVNRIAVLLAGQIATVMAGHEADNGWSNDLERVRKLATRMVVDWGLAPGMEAMAIHSGDKDEITLTPEQAIAVQREVAKLILEGRDLAKARLIEEWPLVRKLVGELVAQGTVTGDAFDGWRKDLRANAAASRPARQPRNPNCEEILSGLR